MGDSPSIDIGSMSQMLQTLFGTPTTTTKKSGDTGALTNQINTAAGNAANPLGVMQPVVNNAVQQAAIQFAPTLQQQNTSGMYNSNVNSMLSSYAQAQAASQAAGLVANYSNSQSQIAATAAAQLAQANSTAKQSTAGLIPSGVQTLLGAGTIASGVYNNAGKVVNAVSDPAGTFGDTMLGRAIGLGPNANIPAGANTVIPEAANQLPAEVTTAPLADAPAAGANAVLPDAVNVPAAVQSVPLASPTSFDAATSVGASATDAATSVGADTAGIGAQTTQAMQSLSMGVDPAAMGIDNLIGGGTLGDAFSGGAGTISSAIGDTIGTSASSFAGTAIDGGANIAGDLFGGAGSILDFGAPTMIGDLAGVGGDMAMIGADGAAIGGMAAADSAMVAGMAGEGAAAGSEILASLPMIAASVVCTALMDQRRISKHWWLLGTLHFENNYSYVAKKAYWFWAKPAARYMRRQPNSVFSKVLGRVFYHRAEYVANFMGSSTARKTLRGFLAYAAVDVITTVIGVATLQWIPDSKGSPKKKELA